MTNNILLWSSYLMIVAVVFLCINNIQAKLATKTEKETKIGKGIARCLMIFILPLVPIILHVTIYLLVAFPQSIEKLSMVEIGLFDMMIQSTGAGVSVILFSWMLGILIFGVRYLQRTFISIKPNSG
ncbi:hypothetical protein MNBD_GAMMA12-3701 [hydrothermal vent metagenome]|uniref:Uncharacterized protein n=1 Tax=hydrothermal vent metagenome TaxID=652676 RepID=A0A3B0YZJ1_9ZZZZ